MNKVHVLKDNQEIPDSYKVEITFINGKTEEFEIAEHNYLKNITREMVSAQNKEKPDLMNITKIIEAESGRLEICTTDDIWMTFEIANIMYMKFDRNFSKIVGLRKKQNDSKL